MKYTATVLALALAVLSHALNWDDNGNQNTGSDGTQNFGPHLTAPLDALDLPNIDFPQARDGAGPPCALSCLGDIITHCHPADYACICHYWTIHDLPRASDCLHTRCGNLESRMTPLVCIQSRE
jgi:CFEM domain